MSEPNFTQEQPRSLLIPALIALLVAGAGFLAAKHFYKSGKVEAAVIQTDILPTTTTMHSNTILVGVREVDHTTFIATRIKLQSSFDQQVFLDEFTLTLTDPSGATLSAKALRRQELSDAEVIFPKLTPLAGNPLVRDAALEPGKAVEGTLVFSFNMPKSVWDTRKSADLKVDLYHNNPITLTLPK